LIWGDGSAGDTAFAVLWCVCNVLIGCYYIFRIGWRILFAGDSLVKRIWGSFIFTCGLGHIAMVYYMAFNHNLSVFHFLVVPVDVLTLIATMEAGHRSPDVPT